MTGGRARRGTALIIASWAVLVAGDTAQAAAPPVALPDTGLFAGVTRQLAARLERLAALPSGARPERVHLLLMTGQNDEAHRTAGALRGTDVAVLVARARAALAVQDFTAAAPHVARLTGRREPEARAVRLSWEQARDAAAVIDSLIRAGGGRSDADGIPELLAAGRLAYDMLDYSRADSIFARVLAAVPAADPAAIGSPAALARSAAHLGRASVMQKRREWDASLAELNRALDAHATAEALETLANTLTRLGRNDESIAAAEWAIRLHPYHDASHYLLGNGWARRSYSQLTAAAPEAFADAAGRREIAVADSMRAAGRGAASRARVARLVAAHPGWVDARTWLASIDFEQGRFEESRDGCFAALATLPDYGRAHAVLAKALESQRFAIDVHRPAYERRFAAAPMPKVEGIERFVVNWSALTPRHQKRVALSIAPWKAFVPVLVAGGATFYIKPLHFRLSECPNLETLRDQRINYDSRLWDDVRGCGGYHTVTGIEDVERTIFDRYDTVVHELTHQVHRVLPADDSRVIEEHYRRAKARDDSTRNAFLSRYAGGSVEEYFAEGGNSLVSPRRDAYDPREVVRERLLALDPELQKLVEGFFARTDVSSSYPIAYAAGGDDRVYRGRVKDGLPFYVKALEIRPGEETVLNSYASSLELDGQAAAAESIAVIAVAKHPTSGPAHLALASARWHAGRDLSSVRSELAKARTQVRALDRYQIDAALGAYAWILGDGISALASYDSVLARQSDSPAGLRGRAAALALVGRHAEAFELYERAVRTRTGVVDLRNDFARDLLAAGRGAEARRQLDEARLLDPENPDAEALRAWAALESNDLDAARAHVRRALTWGPWSDLARIVEGALARRAGDESAAERAWAPVRERIARRRPPEYVYRAGLSSWEHIHTLPAFERRLLERLSKSS